MAKKKRSTRRTHGKGREMREKEQREISGGVTGNGGGYGGYGTTGEFAPGTAKKRVTGGFS